MSKGWNETLIFEHSSLSLDWYLLYCMRFEENPPASELSPLYKAFVRDVLFNVNWNKNMCWQTGHHPSAAGPTMHSCPRRLKMSILLVSAVQRFFMWGSSDIWFCVSSGNPWHMAETCRYFSKVWLLLVPPFYWLSAIPSVQNVHLLYFSSLFSFSSTEMVTVLLWNLDFFLKKEEVWLTESSICLCTEVSYLLFNFICWRETSWWKKNSREVSFEIIAQLLALNSNHFWLWCTSNVPKPIFSFLIQSFWDDINDSL